MLGTALTARGELCRCTGHVRTTCCAAADDPPFPSVPLVPQDMSQSETIFDYSNGVLKAGEQVAVSREDESEEGIFHEMLQGGGVGLRFLQRGARAVPATVKVEEVEVLKFVAATSLAGECEGGAWWLRTDEFNVAASSALHAKYSSLKKSWARVDKESLSMPLFAPRFPGAAGSADDFAALIQHVVDLHNYPCENMHTNVQHLARLAADDPCAGQA